MRIGILGGTFDPPHRAHLEVARAAMEQLELDEVMFVPASTNPLKQRQISESAKHRFNMVRLAIADEPGFSVSDIEISRSGLSFAVETLEELQLARPADYWFIMGSDALKDIYNWKSPDRLVRLCRLAVVVRPPDTAETAARFVLDYMADRVDFIEMPGSAVSATAIRELIRRGLRPDEGDLKPSTLEYIESNGLYRLVESEALSNPS